MGVNEALGFSAEDLHANRNGFLSNAQQQRLAQHQQVRRTGRRFAYVGLLLTNLFFVVVLVVLSAESTIPQPIAWIVTGNLLLFLNGVILLALTIERRRSKLFTGNVSVAEGCITGSGSEFHRDQYGKLLGESYYIRFGRLCLYLDTPAQLASFVENVPYRVYYVRDAPRHVVLSAEIISPQTYGVSQTP